MLRGHRVVYEWGVRLMGDNDMVHRSGLTEQQAREWVSDVESAGADPGAFYVVRREVGPWENA